MPASRWLLLAAPLLLTACEIKKNENPTIDILTPSDGAVNDASSVLVTVDIGNFTLDPSVYPVDDTTHSEPFKGHWHLYLDRIFVDDEFTTTSLLTGVEPGLHEIAAELVNQNHQYIHGTPVAFSNVEIPESAPGVLLDEPDDGDTVASSSAEIAVTLENMVLDTNLGGPNVAGHGHLHVAIDGGPAMEEWSTAFTVTDLASAVAPLSEETPTITVELVQNDHSSFSTPVLDQATVTVPATAPRVAITTPSADATVGTAMNMTVKIANFDATVDFSTAIAETNGQGHYHVVVDGVDALDDFTFPIPPVVVAPGGHDVRFELRSNQHDPLTPPVLDTVHVTAE